MAMAPEYHKGILQVAEPYFVWSLARIANNVACCDHNFGARGVVRWAEVLVANWLDSSSTYVLQQAFLAPEIFAVCIFGH